MKTSKCKGCGAEILWGKTVAGKNMPLDKKPVVMWVFTGTRHMGGELIEAVNVYQPHWANCPKSSEFKKG